MVNEIVREVLIWTAVFWYLLVQTVKVIIIIRNSMVGSTQTRRESGDTYGEQRPRGPAMEPVHLGDDRPSLFPVV